jgi:hypothetical protein
VIERVERVMVDGIFGVFDLQNRGWVLSRFGVVADKSIIFVPVLCLDIRIG